MLYNVLLLKGLDEMINKSQILSLVSNEAQKILSEHSYLNTYLNIEDFFTEDIIKEVNKFKTEKNTKLFLAEIYKIIYASNVLLKSFLYKYTYSSEEIIGIRLFDGISIVMNEFFDKNQDEWSEKLDCRKVQYHEILEKVFAIFFGRDKYGLYAQTSQTKYFVFPYNYNLEYHALANSFMEQTKSNMSNVELIKLYLSKYLIEDFSFFARSITFSTLQSLTSAFSRYDEFRNKFKYSTKEIDALREIRNTISHQNPVYSLTKKNFSDLEKFNDDFKILYIRPISLETYNKKVEKTLGKMEKFNIENIEKIKDLINIDLFEKKFIEFFKIKK